MSVCHNQAVLTSCTLSTITCVMSSSSTFVRLSFTLAVVFSMARKRSALRTDSRLRKSCGSFQQPGCGTARWVSGEGKEDSKA